MSKIKAPDRQKIRDYQTDIQSRDFLTGSYDTDIDAIELGFRSILYQAEQLKLFLDTGGNPTRIETDEVEVEADEGKSDDTIQVVKPAPNLTYIELEALEEETAGIPFSLSRKNPRYTAQNSIASWSNGIRFPVSESMQQALKNANRLGSLMAFESLSDRTKRQMQELSQSMRPLKVTDANWEAKRAVQAVMSAIEIPKPKDFRFSISQAEQQKRWSLENTGSTTVLIETLRIYARPTDEIHRDEMLESHDETRLEAGEAETFLVPDTYLEDASSAEIIFEYRRDSGELRKGKLQIEG
ncbi:hypothetical protein CIK75_06945 [Glutamicibacter sp. BW78]|nr:hypothetical protein CIK75_06945 [Glutamicibacter sp. BW78]